MANTSLPFDVIIDLTRQSFEHWKKRHHDPVVEENRWIKEALANTLQQEQQTVADAHEVFLEVSELRGDCACLEAKNESLKSRIRELETDLELTNEAYKELRRTTLPGTNSQSFVEESQGPPSLTEQLHADLTAEKNKVRDLLQMLKELDEIKSATESRLEAEMRALELVKSGVETYKGLIDELFAANTELQRDKQAGLDREQKLQSEIDELRAELNAKVQEVDCTEYTGRRALIRTPSGPNSRKNLTPAKVTDVSGWESFQTEAEESLKHYESQMTAIMQPVGTPCEVEQSIESAIMNLVKSGGSGSDERIARLVNWTRKRLDQDFEISAATVAEDDPQAALTIKRQVSAAWLQVAGKKWGQAKSALMAFPIYLALHNIFLEIAEWLEGQVAEDSMIP